MARAIALARTVQLDPVELLRAFAVWSCALALILAGKNLPF